MGLGRERKNERMKNYRLITSMGESSGFWRLRSSHAEIMLFQFLTQEGLCSPSLHAGVWSRALSVTMSCPGDGQKLVAASDVCDLAMTSQGSR